MSVLLHFKQGLRTWTVTAQLGQRVMEVANQDGEIFGYCGGQLACTTCRVYIDKKYTRLLSPVSEAEEDVLCELPRCQQYPEKQYERRMSCQLRISAPLHGLTFHIPPYII
jgi:2Fe-2S ferredoxin